jgi:hypothetical protein
MGCRILGGVLLLAGCASVPPTGPGANAPNREVRVTSLPPTAKGVIRAVLSSSDVSLGGHPGCSMMLRHETLGEYMSKWFAELEEPDTHNFVQVEIEKMSFADYRDFFPGEAAPTEPHMDAESGWYALVSVGQSYGEVVWRYGVDFFIKPDGLVDAASFRCIGAP